LHHGWTVGVKTVLRSEPAVKGAGWPSRLLDGLGGLGGWLVGPDPGLNRLRTVLCAMLTIAGAIGAEWLFVHFTGALQRPAPLAAAGAAAAVRVVAVNHAVLIFAMVLGGVIGLTAAISVQDTQPRDQVVSMLVLPVPMIAVLALSLALARHRVLALCLLPLILAAGTYLRRFGPVGVRVGPLLFSGYLFGFLLGSVITLGDIGWLAAEIGVGIVVAIVVKVGVFHENSRRALRRTQRSYAARARRLAGLALAAFDEPGPHASRRLYRQKTRLGEATQLIDGQLADPGVAQADSAAALLHQRLFDSWLALANLTRFAVALRPSPLYAGQRKQVRDILASLRDGRFDSARASALAFAETLTAPADPDGDNTEIIAHRFAGSVTDFTDALSQWLVLGAQDQPGGGALFAPAVPLRQGGSLSVTAAATAEASSTAEPGRYLPRAAVAPYVRTAIQVGVAVGAAIALGDLLSGQRFYWAAIGAFVVFQGTSNTEEQIGKALSRVVGTLVGIVVGSLLVDLIGPHAAWMIVVILASVLLGLYLQRADYAFLVIGITVLVSQLYAELGDFSNLLLVQRLEETAIGAVVAAAVVVAVLPLHASRVARVALRGYLAAMASLLRHAYPALGGEEAAALLQDDTRALDSAYRALASSIQSMRRIQAGGQSRRAGATIVAATSARRYALNLVRDIPTAAVPDADIAALLNRGCQTLQASLTSLQSAVAGLGGCTYTRSASLFDLIEQRSAAPGRGSGDGRLALRDLRMIDGALAELAGTLGLHVTSYDIGPADDQIRSAEAPDPAGQLASSQSAAADGGEPDR
jgi:Fusaric acid resistance protein-like